MSTKIVIVGGGAAGFFTAANCSKFNPKAEVIILEKSSKLLSKVKISGGGRCNVTNATYDINKLIENYPRGGKELKNAFKIFSSKETVQWFEQRGVRLKTEEDERIFPVSDNSQTIIDCLLRESKAAGVKILTEAGVIKIENRNPGFNIHLRNDKIIECDKVLIATGGNPNSDSYNWLRSLGQTIHPPIPSLFTFNVPDNRLSGLQGIAVDAEVKIEGSKLKQQGPILITHWGFSGPAVIKLSAWAAEELHKTNYNFNISINWVREKELAVRDEIEKYKEEHPKKLIISNPIVKVPRRLWERLVELSGINNETRWCDISKKSLNKLLEELVHGVYTVKGKTTFKEEFVTCGGVSLKEINFSTMESKICPGLYFAGEVLNIDGVTGGFNFQAAWTTGYIAAKAMAE
ncbi:MAG TPA: NAD(P)/FAD-dependent oxidoreductase [Cytophagaceae bacterium]